jgi:hypothetical protein
MAARNFTPLETLPLDKLGALSNVEGEFSE